MRAAKGVAGKNLVGVRGEVAVGEEEQFDDRKIDPVLAGQWGADRFGRRCCAVGHSLSWFAVTAHSKLCQPY
jgi:hypothetical protein